MRSTYTRTGGDLDNDGEDEVFACLCVSESWECEHLTPKVSFLVACSGSKDEENGWYTKRYFYFTDGALKYLTTLSDVESKMHYGFVEYFEFSNRNTITVMHISKSRENGTPSVSERESGGYLWNGKDFIDTGGQ